MKRHLVGLCALALLCIIPILPPVQSQSTTTVARDSVRPFSYSISEEITLKGTISSVLSKPQHGMIMGAHLMVTTSTGTVDASLGTLALRDKQTNLLSTGQQVEVTGIMKQIKGQPVFLTRTVKVNNQLYSVRNEHGFPVSPEKRERSNHKSTSNREAL
jgi:DNA/RNA endonuclease YhcR with UshA esterase domain